METSLKVLFITRKWAPAIGGMETYSMEMTTKLSNYCNLTVRFLSGNPDGSPPSAIRLAEFLIRNIFYLFKKRGQYEIVHFGDMVLFPLAYFHSKLDSGAQRFITIHGLDILYAKRHGILPLLYSCFLNWAKHQMNCIGYFITNSRNTSAIAENYGFFPTQPIPLGVNSPSDFNYCSEDDLPFQKPYLLFVGRLVRRKGVKWFVENVLPLLPDPITLCVIGKAWEKAERDAVENNVRVRYLGYVKDSELLRLRRNALAIIMPNIPTPDKTDVEGFGISAVESAAFGIPVVASNIEGLADAVRDQETGFLIPALDAEAWKNQILTIASWDVSFREKFSFKAKRTVEKYYSWERVAKDTFQVYQTVMLSRKNKQ